ncbi:MAG: hypothetical protein BWX80_03847 [Candidatus Hydrogenedentes bacterium ADurb.Bin101]|nr:MAG: hypothetical protein BWX80_03847 [Candidatus Hydrogenedentes bacterium ADurb.Bin101]
MRQEGEVSKGRLFLRVQFKGPQRRTGFEMCLAAHQQFVFRVLFMFLFQALNTFLDNDEVNELQLLLQGDNIPLRIYAAPRMHYIFIFEGPHHVHQRIRILQQIQGGVIQRLVLVSPFHWRDIDELNFGVGLFLRFKNFRQRIHPRVRHFDHRHIGFPAAIRTDFRCRACDRIKHRGFPGPRKTDKPYFHFTKSPWVRVRVSVTPFYHSVRYKNRRIDNG